MSFTGDLEHLPIVDVIQLMNTSRKSGVMSVKGRKGESQLVFKDGYIVSASHLNNSVRIGDVLVEMGFVSPGQIEQALQKQKSDGEKRSPLAITLIDMGLLREEQAYKALQHLIEITIVEILTWKSGKFTLEHLKNVVDCDFRYYPERMDHEINVNTQSILMDALRIFDEKVRDGLIEEESEVAAIDGATADELISEDDLGLSEMDSLAAKLPQAFTVVEPFDPAAFQREKVAELAAELSETDREKLVAMLARHTKEPDSGQGGAGEGPCVAILSSDRLLLHGLDTVLADAGALPVAAGSGEELAKLLAESSERKVIWLISDAPVSNGNAPLPPGIRIVQLVPPNDAGSSLKAYQRGVMAVMPRPVKAPGANFIDEFVLLLELIPGYLRSYR